MFDYGKEIRNQDNKNLGIRCQIYIYITFHNLRMLSFLKSDVQNFSF